jgi:hypothetical protein
MELAVIKSYKHHMLMAPGPTVDAGQAGGHSLGVEQWLSVSKVYNGIQ